MNQCAHDPEQQFQLIMLRGSAAMAPGGGKGRGWLLPQHLGPFTHTQPAHLGKGRAGGGDDAGGGGGDSDDANDGGGDYVKECMHALRQHSDF